MKETTVKPLERGAPLPLKRSPGISPRQNEMHELAKALSEVTSLLEAVAAAGPADGQPKAPSHKTLVEAHRVLEEAVRGMRKALAPPSVSIQARGKERS